MNGGERDAAGHWPSLLVALLYFGVSFLVWGLVLALGGTLAETFGLTPGQQGILAALPILGGLALRLPAGVLADRFGAKQVALGGMALSVVGLLLGWLWASRFAELLLAGMLLGASGASMAVALPLAGRWYRAEHQGVVLGFVGSGNGGIALALLLAPRLMPLVGWRGVCGLALIPLVLALVLVALLARDTPSASTPRRLRDALGVLGQGDVYWFALFYAVTLGGFIGISSFLTIFLRDHHLVDPGRAGMLAAICALIGSLLRPVGGLLADRFGGLSVLFLSLLGLGAVGLRMSYLPHLDVSLVLMPLLMAILGLGNGAVFQMIGQRFPGQLGSAAGLVGALGGLAGLLLPWLMGYSREYFGRFGPAFFALGLSGFVAAGLLLQVSRRWTLSEGLAELPARGRKGRGIEEVMSHG
jgi:NNP family nitrate/nitrite transporter-like MFS transporter